MSIEAVPMEKWAEILPDFSLDQLHGSAVTVHCVESSDFVIGTQTNFNGPVTILNCSHRLEDPCAPGARGKVLILDQVLSLEATTKVREMAIQNRDEREKKISRKKLWCTLASVCVCLGAAVAIASGLLFPYNGLPTEQEDSFPKCVPLAANACLYTNALRSGGSKALDLPVSHVVVTQDEWSFCYDKHACLEAALDFLQNEDLSPCNFLLGGDGNVYRDRGWRLKTLPGDVGRTTLKICFMGNYTDDFPTYPQVLAGKFLLKYGVAHSFVAENYTLASRNCSSAYVFDAIYEVIKKWPHFRVNLLK